MPKHAVVERTLAFDPVSLSAREARRFVRALLREAGHEDWVEATELAVSEVVTNVVLHAHTAFELTVRLADDHVRVEVLDRNPMLPRQRGYDDQATTGRGMALVEAVTDAHGTTELDDGKVVWFCVGDGTATADEDPLDRWDDTGWDDPPAAPPAEGLVTVVLRGMPPTLWLAARQHHDALLRELALYRVAHPESGVRETDLAQADAARTTISSTLEAAVARARQEGTERLPAPHDQPAPLPALPVSLDLELAVPSGSAASFALLQDVLDTAERLAVGEALLVSPGLPEVIAVRDWACEQVISQLAGGIPLAWPGVDDDRFTVLASDDGPSLDVGWDATTVREADRGVVAADDANRIVAVSRPLADALGYTPDALVGRRVVTLVPPRFREAHVAGFTRHLATGEAHVLGVPLELPMLRADGSELPCSFVIESQGTSTGRRVYTAWITPLV